MKRILSIAFLQFRIEFGNKATLITLIGLPLLFTLIFGSMFGGASPDIPVAMVDGDRSVASSAIVRELKGQEGLNAFTVTRDEMKSLFVDKRIAVGIILPDGLQDRILEGRKPSVDLQVLPGDSNGDAVVKPALNRALARVAKGIRTAGEMEGGERRLSANYERFVGEVKGSGVGVRAVAMKRDATKDPGQSVREVSMGFIVMFMMMLVFQMSGVILRERDHGTWGRLLSTPVHRHEIISGYLVSFILSGLFQFALLVTATRLLFGIQWGPLLPMAVVALAFNLAASGMGLFLAGIVRTPDQQGAIGSIFVTVTSMLGGAFWSLDFVGPTMRRLAYFTPQAWAMEGFKEVLLRGGGLADVMLPVAVLAGIAAVFLTAGVARVRYQ